jgi:competence protein ComEC
MPDQRVTPVQKHRFKSPLAALAGSFALGILCARWFHEAPGLAISLPAAAACILAGLLFLRAGWERTAFFLALLSMTFAGDAAMSRWSARLPPDHVNFLESRIADVDTPVTLIGRVSSTPAPAAHGTQFDVEAQQLSSGTQSIAVQGKVRLYVSGSTSRTGGRENPQRIDEGDILRATAKLYRPRHFQDPGSFDYRDWMENIEDIYWVGTVRGLRQIKRLERGSAFNPIVIIGRTRERLLQAIDQIYPPWSRETRNAAVLKAILWGDRSALDSGTVEDFRKTGIYHLLVIAGLHVGLLALLLEFLLRQIGLSRGKRAIVTLSVLIVYSFLVEQRASTLRATLMIALCLFARVLNRHLSPLNSLGGAALVLLDARPAWLFESGFQLSFSAALLIVGVALPVLERTTEPYRRALREVENVLLDDYFPSRLAQFRLELRLVIRTLQRNFNISNRLRRLSTALIVAPLRGVLWIANMVLFSAILQLGLLLPMVEIFHRVTFIGIGLNALAIPVMTALLALALPINLLAAVSPTLAAWPAKLLSLAMMVLFEMARVPKFAPWLSYRVPAPPAWVALGFCTALAFTGFALRFSRRWVRVAAAASVALIALVAMDPFPPHLSEGQFEMTALDCGQGEAIFVVLPNGSTILMDAGGRETDPRSFELPLRRWNAGEEVVSPYLWSRGIKRLDAVVILHPSRENLEGLQAIAENFAVGEIWYPGGIETTGISTRAGRSAQPGIPVRSLAVNHEIRFDGASVRAIPADAANRGASMGLSITVGKHCFLFPEFGLAEAARIAPTSPESGARFSPIGEIRAVPAALMTVPADPVAMILTAGFPNLRERESRPADERRGPGLRVFRTALDGATSVVWNGDSMEVRTWNSEKESAAPRALQRR